MITFLVIWVLVWMICITYEIFASFTHPEDYTDKWWLLKTMGWFAIWPIVVAVIFVLGLYNTIRMIWT